MIRPEEFTGNFLLESVTIPESVKHIGEHAFANCKNLSEVIISDNVFNIDCGAFSNCESLGEIFIPNSVTNIGADAFYGCKNLTIRAFKGSYVKRYALENEIPFEEI